MAHRVRILLSLANHRLAVFRKGDKIDSRVRTQQPSWRACAPPNAELVT
jgi:hypothetical protein